MPSTHLGHSVATLEFTDPWALNGYDNSSIHNL